MDIKKKLLFYFENGPTRTQSLKVMYIWKVFRNCIFNPILMRFLFELIVLRASASMSTDFFYIFQSVFIDVIVFSFFSSKKSMKSKKKSKKKKRKRKYSTESSDSADSGEEEDSELMWVEKSRLK